MQRRTSGAVTLLRAAMSMQDAARRSSSPSQPVMSMSVTNCGLGLQWDAYEHYPKI